MTLPGVGALKQTSGDLFQMEQIRREHPDLVLYNGYDEILPPACWPARTGIGSTYNIMGWRYRAIANAVREGITPPHSACKANATRLSTC